MWGTKLKSGMNMKQRFVTDGAGKMLFFIIYEKTGLNLTLIANEKEFDKVEAMFKIADNLLIVSIKSKLPITSILV